MMSVRDIFVAALSLKANGKPLHEIRAAILDMGRANGFSAIDEIRGEDTFEIIFDTAGKISFDGRKLYYGEGTDGR